MTSLCCPTCPTDITRELVSFYSFLFLFTLFYDIALWALGPSDSDRDEPNWRSLTHLSRSCLLSFLAERGIFRGNVQRHLASTRGGLDWSRVLLVFSRDVFRSTVVPRFVVVMMWFQVVMQRLFGRRDVFFSWHAVQRIWGWWLGI